MFKTKKKKNPFPSAESSEGTKTLPVRTLSKHRSKQGGAGSRASLWHHSVRKG